VKERRGRRVDLISLLAWYGICIDVLNNSMFIVLICKYMKIKYINSIRTILTLIAVSFLFWNNARAQYSRPPWVRPYPPYRRVIVQNPPPQDYRQDYRQNYNTNMQNDYNQPFINFSMHFDPLISWFSTDSYDTRNDGAVAGFTFGVSYNKYFGENYSFSSGLNITRAGGRLINRDVTHIELKNYYNTVFTVEPGEPVTYRITYLSVPLGLKLQTNQSSNGRFFTDVGFDPKIVLGGRADIPSINIKEGNVTPGLNLFNFSFHVLAGVEYPLSGSNALIVGLGFETSIFDVTSDNRDQLSNLVSQKILSLRIGMTF